jgi:hypothetical protein
MRHVGKANASAGYTRNFLNTSVPHSRRWSRTGRAVLDATSCSQKKQSKNRDAPCACYHRLLAWHRCGLPEASSSDLAPSARSDFLASLRDALPLRGIPVVVRPLLPQTTTGYRLTSLRDARIGSSPPGTGFPGSQACQARVYRGFCIFASSPGRVVVTVTKVSLSSYLPRLARCHG